MNASPNPMTPPAKRIKKHSSNLNLFAVKDHIPAMVAKIKTNPKYNFFDIFLSDIDRRAHV